MLTRLKVSGFKNLIDVDVRFGPFTCVAGPNGVGKSNLMDAIRFLSLLASESPMDAASAVRDAGGRSTDPRNLFYNFRQEKSPRMDFEVEMIVPREATDDLGFAVEATATLLRYSLSLGWESANGKGGADRLFILREALSHIPLPEASNSICFPHDAAWRERVVAGSFRVPVFISTEGEDNVVVIHDDFGTELPPSPLGGGQRKRTILGATGTSLFGPTVLTARREFESWRVLQLEPSSLRGSDGFRHPQSLSSIGAHMPATLFRLASSEDGERVYTQLANRLAELVGDVRSVEVDRDEARELLTLYLTQSDGTRLPASALSDGTLRFLALSILALDPQSTGLVCLEEPENGIHPMRIPAMIDLLRDLAVDPNDAGEFNPLRQVIFNTHSPLVVKQCPEDSVVFARTLNVPAGTGRGSSLGLACLPGTWREKAGMESVGLGTVVNYLEPTLRQAVPGAPRRVIDRPELQTALGFNPDETER